MIVSLKVTLAMCGSLASTVSDSENDEDAFVGPITSWFVLIGDRCKIKLIPNTNYGIHKASSIFKCNLTVYVGLRDNLGEQSSPIYIDGSIRVGGSSHSLPRKSVSRPKKHTLTQQLSVPILLSCR